MKPKMILFSFQKFLSAVQSDRQSRSRTRFDGLGRTRKTVEPILANPGKLIQILSRNFSFPGGGSDRTGKLINLDEFSGNRFLSCPKNRSGTCSGNLPWTGSRFLKFSCFGPVGSRTRSEPLGLGPTNSGPSIPDWYAF